MVKEIMLPVIFDDEYMYKKMGESDEAFELRMDKLRAERAARMTNEDKQRVENLLNGLETAEKKLFSFTHPPQI